MRRGSLALLLMGLLAIVPASAKDSGFDPRRLKNDSAAVPNDVMVLGTAHLSEWPKDFDPALLGPLIGRLATWKPAMIAVEDLSGAQCDMLRHYPRRYTDSVKDYCWDPAPARAATGMDLPTATEEAQKLLASWPAQPAPNQRRHLAALFLASGEQGSALVQWLRLDPKDRIVGDGLDDALVARLETLRNRHDETMLIAAPLAARLGLERLVAMDDHSADAPIADEKAYGAAIMAAWDNPATKKRRAEDDALTPNLNRADGVLAAYRSYNAPANARLIYDSDFGAALRERSPQQFGRGYVGYW